MNLWHRVLAPCPRCRRLPALHLEAWLVRLARSVDPDRPILDYQCDNWRCTDENGKRITFAITAHDVARAELVRADAA